MRVACARVWRRDQRLDPQRDALLADLCERVFEEKIFSRKADRKASSSGPRRINLSRMVFEDYPRWHGDDV
jgi:hypothetical protein